MKFKSLFAKFFLNLAIVTVLAIGSIGVVPVKALSYPSDWHKVITDQYNQWDVTYFSGYSVRVPYSLELRSSSGAYLDTWSGYAYFGDYAQGVLFMINSSFSSVGYVYGGYFSLELDDYNKSYWCDHVLVYGEDNSSYSVVSSPYFDWCYPNNHNLMRDCYVSGIAPSYTLPTGYSGSLTLNKEFLGADQVEISTTKWFNDPFVDQSEDITYKEYWMAFYSGTIKTDSTYGIWFPGFSCASPEYY